MPRVRAMEATNLSLRGAKRRSNPGRPLDCFAALAMTSNKPNSSPPTLPRAAAFANARRFAWPRRSIHVDLTRAHAEGLTPYPRPARPPFAEPAVAVSPGFSQEPGDGRLDHSVEPGPH